MIETKKKPNARASMRSATAMAPVLAAFSAAAALGPNVAEAAPTGGTVVAGDATITTRGSETTIVQGGEKVVIDWRSFDIEADEAVKFLQPGADSIALNRVLDGLPTNIRGQLEANGNVWIVNQHGVVFHAGAMVDVGGLLATTADISNADFMAGNYRFDKPGDPGAEIINEGSITFGQAGLAAFVAPGAENRGVIAGKMGKVVIAGAETFAVDLAGDGMFAFTVEGAGASAKNAGRIHNPGGYILISASAAQGMVDSQISVGGVVEARSAEVKGGKIVLSGDGHVEVSGALDVTGTEAGAVGGGIEITGETVHVTGSASLDASGDAAGGSVKVGGDYQGGGNLKTASRTVVSEGAAIKANAIGEVGDGGEVILWADQTTAFKGRIEARGGLLGGDGGFAEVSGKENLLFTGVADLGAPAGAVGELLLDPTNIIIQAAGADDAELADDLILFGDGGAVDFTLTAATLNASTADVTLQATNDITVDAAVNMATALTLDAGNDIILNADVSALDLALTADADFSAGGGDASDGAGSIIFGGGALSAADIVLIAGEALTLGDVTATGGLSITTSNDDVTQLAGTAVAADGATVLTVVDAGTGDVTLTNAGNDFAANGAGGNVSVTADDIQITDLDGVTLGPINGSTLTLAAGGAVDQADALAITGASDFDAAGFDLTLEDAANAFGGPVALTGDAVSIVSAGALVLGDVTATASLSITTADEAIAQSAGTAITADGATVSTMVDAGTGDVTLANAGNDFSASAAAANVSITGGAIRIADLDGVSVGAVDGTSLALDAGGDVSLGLAGSSISVAGGDVVANADGALLVLGDVTTSGAGDIRLTSNANMAAARDIDFAGGATVSAADALVLTTNGGMLTSDDAGAVVTLSSLGAGLDLAASDFDGGLTVYAGGAITQSGALDIAEGANFDATGFDITLNDAGNDFGDAVALRGEAVAITADGPLNLGETAAASLNVNQTGAAYGVYSAGDDIIVTGSASIIAEGDIDIVYAAGSEFGGAVILSAGGDVDFATANAGGDLNLGEVTATIGAVAIDVAANGAVLTDDVSANGGAGAVAISTSGDIAQTGGAISAGALSADADGGDVTLEQAANAVAAFSATNAADVSLVDVGGVALGPLDADAADVNTTGDVTQTAAADVGTLTVTAAPGGGGAYGDITLTNAGNAIDAANLRGGDVSVVTTDAIVLGAVSTDGDLTVAAAGAITQTADDAITVSGDANLTAANGGARYDVTLDNADNDFADAVYATNVTGAAITLRDADDLALGTIDASVSATITADDAGASGAFQGGLTTLSLTDMDGDMTLAAALNLPTSITAFDATSGGGITAQGLSLANADADLAAAGAVAFENASSFGALDVEGATTISQAAGSSIAVAADTDLQASGAITLANAGNDFADAGASTAADGATISLADADGILLGDIASDGDVALVAGGAVAQEAGSAITAPGATSIVAAGQSVNLTQTGNDFGGAVDVTAAATSLTDVDGVTLGDVSATTLTVIAGGDISQSSGGAILSGASSFATVGDDVTLANAGNDFSGAVDVDGANVAITDATGLELGTVSATGDLTVIARGGAISDGAGGVLNIGGDANFEATDGAAARFDLTLDNAGHVFDGDLVTFVADAATIRSSTGFAVSNATAAGDVTLVAEAGDLDVAQLTGAVGATDLLAIAEAGGVVAEDVIAASATLGGVGSVLGAATAADGAIAADRLILGAGASSFASVSEVALTDMTIQGDLAVRAPIQRFDNVSSPAFLAAGPFDFNAEVSGAAADIDLLTFERMTFGADLTAQAGELRFAFVRLLGDENALTATVGDLGKPADADIDFDAAGTDAFVVANGRSAGTTAASGGYGAFEEVFLATGETSLAAAGDIVVTRAVNPDDGQTFQSAFGGVVNIDGVNAAIESENALTLGAVTLTGDLAARADTQGNFGGVYQTADGVTVAGTTHIIAGTAYSRAYGGYVDLSQTTNQLGEVRIASGAASIADADGFTVAAADVAGDLTLAATNGALEVGDAQVDGALSIATTGDVTVQRVATGDLTASTSLGDVDVSDLISSGGYADLTATAGAISVDDFRVEELIATAGGAISATDGVVASMGDQRGLAIEAGGDVTIRNIDVSFDAPSSLGGRSVSADGALSVDALRISGGDLSLSGQTGVALGTVDAGGALSVTSGAGAIQTMADGAEAPLAFTIDQSGGAVVGFASELLIPSGAASGADPRVTETIAAGAAETVSTGPFDMLLDVDGDASFIAAGAISLLRESAAGGGLHNDLGVLTTLTSGGGGVAAEDVDALTFASIDTGAGDLSVRSNSDNAGPVVDNGIDQVGAIVVGGDAAFITGDHDDAAIASVALLGDVALDAPENQFAGAVSVIAADASIVDQDGFTLRDSRASGDLNAAVAAAGSAGSTITAADVAAGGDVSLSAGALAIERLAAGGAITTEATSGQITGRDVSAGALATFDAVTTFDLNEAAFADLTVTAGATARLTDVIGRSISVTSGGLTIDRLSSDSLTISSDGDAAVSRIASSDADIAVVNGDADLSLFELGGPLRLSAAGDVTLADMSISGDGDVQAEGALSAERLAVDGDLNANAGGNAVVEDLLVGGEGVISAGSQLTLSDAAVGDLTVEASELLIRSLNADRLTATSRGAAAIRDARANALDLDAAGDVTLGALAIVGDLDARTTAGDVRLGAISVAGDLDVTASAGAISAVAEDIVINGPNVAGPNGAAAPGFTVDGPAAGLIGGAGVDETTTAEGDMDFAGPTLPGRSGRTFGDTTLDSLLIVDGAATFEAQGDVTLARDLASVPEDNEFRGGVAVRGANDVLIEHAGDLTLGAGGVGVNARGDLTATASGGVTQAARLVIGGDVSIAADGDVTLTDAANAVTGAVGASGRDISLSEAGSIDLAAVTATGDLTLLAGANASATGPAAIRQTSGAIIVDGDATITSGLAASVAVDANGLGGDRDVALSNAANVFGGDLSVARISGDVTIVEESTATTMGTDANDGGVLGIRNFEVGGSSTIATTDDVVFYGRLTDVGDAAAPPRLARPTDANPSAQGDLGIADDDLRLFIANGSTLTIDATGRGIDVAGGNVRFDRAVDGANDLPPVGSASIAADRAGLGGLTVNAGSNGEVRFRDFVGAARPLGAVDIRGRDFLAGFTLETALPDDTTNANRFLFDAAAQDDFFFAGSLRINVSGALLAATPSGAIDTFILTDQYFGVNVGFFRFGDLTIPTTAEAFGFIGNTRTRAGGLFPVSPRSPDFKFNDCVIGDISDCSNVPTPNVVNAVLIVEPPLLDVSDEDLLELFGSFGNEELWGVPQSFFLDFGDDEDLDCPEGDDECS